MSTFLEHLAMHSLGLAVCGAAITALLFRLRRDPEASYRIAVVFVYAALALPCLQLAVGGRWAVAAVARAETPRSAEPTVAPPLDARAPLAALPERWPAQVGNALAAPLPYSAANGPVRWNAARAARAKVGAYELGDLVLALYVAGCAVALAVALRRLHATHRLVRRCTPLEDPAALALWQRLAAGSRRGARARLFTSPELASPGCWGLGRPLVLVPARALEPRHQAALECALEHELVHLERGDAHAALAELAVGVLFWFHPVVHWVRRELARLREMSCDLAVVRRTGRARSYALALLDYARIDSDAEAREPELGATLLHWTHSRTHLRRRIEMLARHDKDKPLASALPKLAALFFGTAWSAQLAAAAIFLPAPQEPAALAPAAPSAEEPQAEQDIEALLAELEALAAELDAPAPSAPAAWGAPAAPAPPLAATPAFPGVPPVPPGDGSAPLPATPPAPPSAPTPPAGHGGHVLSTHPFAVAGTQNGVLVWTSGADRRLGIGLGAVGPLVAEQLGLDASGSLVVTQVAPGSTAERAGLRVHDILTGLPGGAPVTQAALQRCIREAEPGEPFTLEIVRKGRREHVQVEFGAGEPHSRHPFGAFEYDAGDPAEMREYRFQVREPDAAVKLHELHGRLGRLHGLAKLNGLGKLHALHGKDGAWILRTDEGEDQDENGRMRRLETDQFWLDLPDFDFSFEIGPEVEQALEGAQRALEQAELAEWAERASRPQHAHSERGPEHASEPAAGQRDALRGRLRQIERTLQGLQVEPESLHHQRVRELEQALERAQQAIESKRSTQQPTAI